MLVEFRNYLSSISDVANIKEENNTISFEYKGLFFWFVTDESDQYYIRLILPNIANIDSIKDGVDVHDAINAYSLGKFHMAIYGAIPILKRRCI